MIDLCVCVCVRGVSFHSVNRTLAESQLNQEEWRTTRQNTGPVFSLSHTVIMSEKFPNDTNRLCGVLENRFYLTSCTNIHTNWSIQCWTHYKYSGHIWNFLVKTWDVMHQLVQARGLRRDRRQGAGAGRGCAAGLKRVRRDRPERTATPANWLLGWRPSLKAGDHHHLSAQSFLLHLLRYRRPAGHSGAN